MKHGEGGGDGAVGREGGLERKERKRERGHYSLERENVLMPLESRVEAGVVMSSMRMRVENKWGAIVR